MSLLSRVLTVGLGLLIVAEVILISLWYGDWGNKAPTLRVDPAAMLVVITTVAVGIERAIELLWTCAGRRSGPSRQDSEEHEGGAPGVPTSVRNGFATA